MGRLQGKDILITGGSSGIGLASAIEFHREGARVAICGLNQGRIFPAKLTLGPSDVTILADVSKLSELDSLFAKLREEGCYHLDALSANAGLGQFEPFCECDGGDIRSNSGCESQRCALHGPESAPISTPWELCDIGCISCCKGWPNCNVVSAMKAGLASLAKTMNSELGAHH